MAMHDFDLIVIGAGSGGVRASRISAGHGARVAVIEESRPGGTCVIRGCVPKKLLMYGSAFSADAADAAGYGWRVTVDGHDWPALIAAKDSELDRLEGIYRSLLGNAGVELIEGRGTVTGPHSVSVNGREITAGHILIATGGWPQIPDVPGLADHAITSNEALDLPDRPDSVLVYGAGYIAVEFASIFNGFGIETHLVYRGDLPLRGFDEDIRLQSAEALAGRGIILHPGCTLTEVTAAGDRRIAALSNGSRLDVAQVMAATGRAPNTAGLGLEAAGVELGRGGEIIVDPDSRTSVASIYAVGDVTDRIALTPVAIAEGHALADSLFGGRPRQVSHHNVPSAVFTQPPIGSVGMTEAQAAEAFDKITVFTSKFNAMKNTLSGRSEKTFMKLIVETATDTVVGAHMLGPDAGEIMQGIGVAVIAGATKADFDATIGIHPTAAEEFVTMRTPRA
ncbi:MAG: glutathione-disulfide reductase [Pseudomonadota bacterium]|nr:glutathione-disulfide reductase [Pseudomonadota bacterium]